MEKINLDTKSIPPPYRRTPPPTPASSRLLHNLTRTPRRVVQTLLISALIAFFILSHGGYRLASGKLWPLSSTESDKVNYEKPAVKISLEAHMMSKCPDARDCLRDLVVPAMEKIADKVDFRMSYIGQIADDESITCKHGPTECLGNILSLCAADLYPTTSSNTTNTKISLGFTMCMISSYQKIPERSLIESCALEHGVDFEKLNACVSEEGKGLDLLRKSVERSEHFGVKTSCTVRLGGVVRCVRDGGEWKDCESPYGSNGSGRVEQLIEDVNHLSYVANRPGEHHGPDFVY